MNTPDTPKRLYRSRKNRVLGGICGGLGEYFNVDPVMVRIGFIVISLLPGPSVIFYLIGWVVIPEDPS